MGFVEQSVSERPADQRYQFEREGYFIQDEVDGRAGMPVFNEIVGLKDSADKCELARKAQSEHCYHHYSSSE